jgi:hypothetical protein
MKIRVKLPLPGSVLQYTFVTDNNGVSWRTAVETQKPISNRKARLNPILYSNPLKTVGVRPMKNELKNQTPYITNPL